LNKNNDIKTVALESVETGGQIKTTSDLQLVAGERIWLGDYVKFDLIDGKVYRFCPGPEDRLIVSGRYHTLNVQVLDEQTQR